MTSVSHGVVPADLRAFSVGGLQMRDELLSLEIRDLQIPDLHFVSFVV